MDARRIHQLSGLALLGLAAALVYGSLQLRYFTSLGPGPGFFPLWLSLVLGVLALVMIAQATLGGDLPAEAAPDRAGYLRMLAIVAAIAGAALGLDRLGFATTMLVANLFVLFAMGWRRPVPILIVALCGSFGVFHIFTRLLNVPLPAGPFGF